MEKRSRRDNGAGTIYQKENGTWIGRISTANNGKSKFKYVSGKTEAEVKKKIREFQLQSSAVSVSRITVEDYLDRWLKLTKSGTVRRSSYDRIENTIKFQIVPHNQVDIVRSLNSQIF